MVNDNRAVAGLPSSLKASRGRSSPLGATVSPDGVNFSVFSRGSTAVHLLLFDDANDEAPARVIALDRTYQYWHAFVPGLRP